MHYKYQEVKIWKNISSEIQTAPNLKLFEKKLKKYLFLSQKGLNYIPIISNFMT